MTTCSVRGCSTEVRSRGWCSKHYQRWRSHGDPTIVVTPVRWDGRCTTCKRRDRVFHANNRRCKTCRAKELAVRRAKNPEHTRRMAREGATRCYRRWRASALAAYGGVCQCCREARMVFLVIDHVAGGGNEHRRSISNGRMGGSYAFYRWLNTNKFPPGFQVLCHNCNFAKSHGGCPHQEEAK